MNSGIGFDIHPLVEGKKLVLGGVEIPHRRGLDGWSDADVLTHAIMDALLGAVAMGDIGVHFPPGLPQYKGVSSLMLLTQVRFKLAAAGWKVNNIDATIIAEKPKLREYIDTMRQNLSDILGIPMSRVSVKASTMNKVGSLGNEEGIACLAIATVNKSRSLRGIKNENL